MELRGRKLVVDFFLFFLNDEWGMKGCEDGGVMMMVIMKQQGILAYHEKVK